jgi:ABC-type uncharacterized transport system permease subunit
MRAILLGAILLYSAFVVILVPYMSDAHRQTSMPAAAWLALLCSVAVCCLYAPTHAVLVRTVRASDQSSEAANVGR